MKSTSKILAGVFILAISAVSNAKGSVAVEWAPFIKKHGISDQQLIMAAERLNSEFLTKQAGFIKRELIKKSAREYADIIHWKTKVEAEAAGEKVFNCAQCNGYFELMDMEASAGAGTGFSHYEILQTWN
jgi:hypothetical protein